MKGKLFQTRLDIYMEVTGALGRMIRHLHRLQSFDPLYDPNSYVVIEESALNKVELVASRETNAAFEDFLSAYRELFEKIVAARKPYRELLDRQKLNLRLKPQFEIEVLEAFKGGPNSETKGNVLSLFHGLMVSQKSTQEGLDSGHRSVFQNTKEDYEKLESLGKILRRTAREELRLQGIAFLEVGS